MSNKKNTEKNTSHIKHCDEIGFGYEHSSESQPYDPKQSMPNDRQFSSQDDWRYFDPCGINWYGKRK